MTAVSGSSAIVGAGTTWTKAMIGRSIKITSTDTVLNGLWLEIIDVTDATHLTTKEAASAAGTGLSYTIDEMIPFPEGFEDVALWWALDLHYKGKEKTIALAREYERMWKEGLRDMLAGDKLTIDNIFIKGEVADIIDPNTNPATLHIS